MKDMDSVLREAERERARAAAAAQSRTAGAESGLSARFPWLSPANGRIRVSTEAALSGSFLG